MTVYCVASLPGHRINEFRTFISSTFLKLRHFLLLFCCLVLSLSFCFAFLAILRYDSSVKRVKCTFSVCVCECVLFDNRINRNYNWNLLSHKSFPVSSEWELGHLTHLRDSLSSSPIGLTLSFYVLASECHPHFNVPLSALLKKLEWREGLFQSQETVKVSITLQVSPRVSAAHARTLMMEKECLKTIKNYTSPHGIYINAHMNTAGGDFYCNLTLYFVHALRQSH